MFYFPATHFSNQLFLAKGMAVSLLPADFGLPGSLRHQRTEHLEVLSSGGRQTQPVSLRVLKTR